MPFRARKLRPPADKQASGRESQNHAPCNCAEEDEPEHERSEQVPDGGETQQLSTQHQLGYRNAKHSDKIVLR